MTSVKETLISSLRDHSARIGVLGLGYVGLPLAAAFGDDVVTVDDVKKEIDEKNTLENSVHVEAISA